MNGLAYLCLALLLLATTAQATHVCALQSWETDSAAQVTSGSSANAICLTCLMAQWATAVLVAISFFLALRPKSRTWFVPIETRTNTRFFQLYVRPPPAFQ